jgi:Sec7-like guanine-nucleotide exchange factor
VAPAAAEEVAAIAAAVVGDDTPAAIAPEEAAASADADAAASGADDTGAAAAGKGEAAPEAQTEQSDAPAAPAVAEPVEADAATEATPAPESAPEAAQAEEAASAAVPAAATAAPPAAATAAATGSDKDSKDLQPQRFPTLLHRDAFLLFRALCLLSMSGGEQSLLPQGADAASAAEAGAAFLSDDALLADPVALQSKLLALDLLLSVLDASGPAFRSGPRFVAATKQYLCVGLLKNILSSIPAVSSLAIKLFISLTRHLKEHLAEEVEVFISTVFLRILSSPNAPFDTKLGVLQAFKAIASDPAAVLEMFLNYDCQAPSRQALFEDSLKALSSIAQGRAGEDFNSTQRTAAEALAVKQAAVAAISAIAQSLVVMADAAAKEQSALAQGGAAAALQAAAAAASSTLVSATAPAPGEGSAATSAAAAAGAESTAAAPAADAPDAVTDSAAAIGAAADDASESPQAAHQHSASAALARSYDEQKRRRVILEKGAVKFSVKPRSGVDYLVSQGICDGTPAGIARMFHELKDVLEKTALGDYIGEEKAITIQVLHEYVDQMDFTNVSFDNSIRVFLSGFRLPGEAQKIDRIMEKFAQRFCQCNPDLFPNADTAFILAYSTIMLQTDAHNPNIKPERKMTKAGFISNNRGIANGADLPAEFLSAIYDNIVSNAISLKEDDDKRKQAQTQTAGDEKSRKMLQAAERAELVKAGQAAFSSARRRDQPQGAAATASVGGDSAADSGTSATTGNGAASSDGSSAGASRSSGRYGYISIHDVVLSDHVKPLFDVAWVPLLAAFSVMLEMTGDDDPRTINACLVGFAQCIHIGSQLRLDVPRDAFVATLAKFTNLEPPGSGVREMRGKNIACTRALLNIALNEGDRLGSAWGPVLVCASLLARYLLLAQGGREDSEYFAARAQKAGGSAGGPGGHPLQQQSERDAIFERANAALIASAVAEADVTRLYTRSVSLSNDAAVDFVQQLVNVSLQELASVMPRPQGQQQQQLLYPLPRIFSLQKVVEVADFNMDTRARIVWARIWEVLSRYFATVCCASNTNVSMYAIDSLKQLSAKFLEKPELRAFHFQTKFLQPFLSLMEAGNGSGATVGTGPAGPSSEVRELILHVCTNLIHARAHNIRSGWRTFLGVYAAAASDPDELLVSLAFGTVHEILTTHLEAVAESGAFVDAVKCMVAFGSNPHTLFALRAIDHCCTLGANLARGKVPLTEASLDELAPTGGAAAAQTQAPEEEALWYNLDGSENADVRASELAAAKAVISAGTGSASIGDPDAEPEGQGSGTGDIFAHEDATDAALLAADGSKGGDIRRFTDNRVHLRLWWPLLTGLARLVASDPRLPVRIRAMEALFALLRRYGPGFSTELWTLIYTGVLMPIFDDVRHAAEDGDFEEVDAGAQGRSPRQPHARTGSTGGHGSASAGAGASDIGTSAESLPPPTYSMSDFTSRSALAPRMPSAAQMKQYIPGIAAAAEASAAAAAALAGPGGDGRPVQQAAGSGVLFTGASRRGGRAQAPVQRLPSLEPQEWLRTTCFSALASLVRLQNRFFTRLSPLLQNLLRLVESCIDQPSEGLARVGVAALRLLLAEAGPRFDQSTWDLVCVSLERLFVACAPSPLLDARKILFPPIAPPAAPVFEDAADEDGSFSSGEDSDEDQKEEEAAEPEVEDDGAADANDVAAVASTGGFAVGTSFTTAYGESSIVEVRIVGKDRDVGTVPSALVVQLPWAVCYLPREDLAAAPVPTPAEPEAKAVAAAPRQSPRRAKKPATDDVAGTPTRTSRKAKAASALASPDSVPRPSVVTPAAKEEEDASAVSSSAFNGALPFDSVRVVTQCVVQLELISAVGVLAGAHLDSLTKAHVDTLITLLEKSAAFARAFNADRALRSALWRAGFMRYARHNKLPSLLRQETAATQQLLVLLMNLYKHDNNTNTGAAPTGGDAEDGWRSLALGHLIGLSSAMLKRYTQLAIEAEKARLRTSPSYMHGAVAIGNALRILESSTASGMSSPAGAMSPGAVSGEAPDNDRDVFREAAAYGPLVLTLLEGLLAFDDRQFKENLHWLYPLLTGLIVAGNLEIRALVKMVFDGRLQRLIPVE